MSYSVIILAGGFGSRLKSISNGIPKALMPIGSRVYLDFLLEKIFLYNISHVHLSLYYKPDIFVKYIENSNYKDKLSYLVEPKPLGTGGAINFVINRSDISSPFFVINGDSISNIDLGTMANQFQRKSYCAMIGISKVSDAKRYGTVKENNGEIISFNEKGFSGAGWINNGNYLFTKKAFNNFEDSFSLENDLFPLLIKKREIGAYKVLNDKFIDMGIPDDYRKFCNIKGVKI